MLQGVHAGTCVCCVWPASSCVCLSASMSQIRLLRHLNHDNIIKILYIEQPRCVSGPGPALLLRRRPVMSCSPAVAGRCPRPCWRVRVLVGTCARMSWLDLVWLFVCRGELLP
jgi:hypothetical protein